MIDEMTSNLRPTEALLYTPPDGFEIVPMPGPDEPVPGVTTPESKNGGPIGRH